MQANGTALLPWLPVPLARSAAIAHAAGDETMSRKESSDRILPSLVLFLFVFVLPLCAVERTGSISGVVMTSSDAPAVGAAVRVRNKDLGLTVSVISRDGGKYNI